MRLRTVTAPDARQAMARLRAALGESAVIVATQQVDGGVRITGAVENDEVDLGDLLAAPEASPCLERTPATRGRFHLFRSRRCSICRSARASS